MISLLTSKSLWVERCSCSCANQESTISARALKNTWRRLVCLIQTFTRSKFGSLHIQRNSQSADPGKFLQRDLWLKTIAMMTKTQDLLKEIWVIRDLFTWRKKMLISTEALKSSSSTELTATGKSRQSFLPIASWIMELRASQMDPAAAQSVLVLNATHVPNLRSTQRHTMLHPADMMPSHTVIGFKEFIPESTEISKSSMLWESGKDSVPKKTPQSLASHHTADKVSNLSQRSSCSD